MAPSDFSHVDEPQGGPLWAQAARSRPAVRRDTTPAYKALRFVANLLTPFLPPQESPFNAKETTHAPPRLSAMSGWFRRGAAPAGGAAGASADGLGPSPASGVPLELIKWDEATSRFCLGQQALDVLKRTRGPVGVVAVCGRARQVGRAAHGAPAARRQTQHRVRACCHGKGCLPEGQPSFCLQGKSFILNQLLGRSGGFQVAPTHRPCTKGG